MTTLPERESLTVDLNADLGEGFGVWRLGPDEDMMVFITSANVACGLHAGDPGTMRRTVRMARERGVVVGAHPGYPDLAGFGRRPMNMPPGELIDILLYQIGALQAVARAEGTAVRYVKVHGALYNQAAQEPEAAWAVAEALRQTGGDLPLVGPPASAFADAAARAGLRFVAEGFADRTYEDDGRLTPRSRPGAVLTDPEAVAARVVSLVRDRAVLSRDGSRVPLAVETVCLHGDTPGALRLARAVRQALEEAGVRVASFA